jgi:hypothetical protein
MWPAFGLRPKAPGYLPLPREETGMQSLQRPLLFQGYAGKGAGSYAVRRAKNVIASSIVKSFSPVGQNAPGASAFQTQEIVDDSWCMVGIDIFELIQMHQVVTALLQTLHKNIEIR